MFTIPADLNPRAWEALDPAIAAAPPTSEVAIGARLAYAFGHLVHVFPTDALWAAYGADWIELRSQLHIEGLLQRGAIQLVQGEAIAVGQAGDTVRAQALFDLATKLSSERGIHLATKALLRFQHPAFDAIGRQPFQPVSVNEWFDAGVGNEPDVVAFEDATIRITPDGIVNLGPRQPEHRIRSRIRRSYDDVQAAAPPTMWTEHTLGFFVPDPERQSFLRLILGTALLGGALKNKVMVQLYGDGANGKSTIANTVAEVVDGYGVKLSSRFFVRQRGDTNDDHRAYLTRAVGKRYGTNANEIPNDPHATLNDRDLKAATEGQDLPYRPMRQEETSFIPQMTLVVATNHEIPLQSTGSDLRRRLLSMHMDVSLPPGQINTSFTRTMIETEGAAITRWLLDAAVDYLRYVETSGRTRWEVPVPKAISESTADYFEDQSIFGQFVRERLIPDPHGSLRLDVIKDAYVDWLQRRFPADEVMMIMSTEQVTERSIGKRLARSEFPNGPRTHHPTEARTVATRRAHLAYVPATAIDDDTLVRIDNDLATLLEVEEERLTSDYNLSGVELTRYLRHYELTARDELIKAADVANLTAMLSTPLPEPPV